MTPGRVRSHAGPLPPAHIPNEVAILVDRYVELWKPGVSPHKDLLAKLVAEPGIDRWLTNEIEAGVHFLLIGAHAKERDEEYLLSLRRDLAAREHLFVDIRLARLPS